MADNGRKQQNKKAAAGKNTKKTAPAAKIVKKKGTGRVNKSVKKQEKAAPAKTPAAKEEAPAETAQADTPQEITKAMVKELLVSKSRGNHSDEVKELLHKYGASSISEIMKSDRLQEFYKEAEVIGDAG